MKPGDTVAFPVRPGRVPSAEHLRGVVVERANVADWWLVDVAGQRWGVHEVMAVVVEGETLTWV